ncbi:MAG TPA: hypothetical protein VIM02_08895 [Rhizomicrobium sp.]|jgi:hypothetical protein
MNRTPLALIVLVGLLSTPLAAQVMPNAGVPVSHGATLLKVTATKPYLLGPAERFSLGGSSQGRFRLLFRIVSAVNEDLPITLVSYGGLRSDYLFHWTAYSSTGARCFALKEDASGISVFGHFVPADSEISALQKEDDSETRASRERPTIISIDFDCDTPIHPGDAVSVQTKVFVLSNYRWVEADYTFENLVLGEH